MLVFLMILSLIIGTRCDIAEWIVEDGREILSLDVNGMETSLCSSNSMSYINDDEEDPTVKADSDNNLFICLFICIF